MNLFEAKGIHPMLLTERREPIESAGWLSELKLDGIRCIAYLRPGETDLRNKRNLLLLPGAERSARRRSRPMYSRR